MVDTVVVLTKGPESSYHTNDVAHSQRHIHPAPHRQSYMCNLPQTYIHTHTHILVDITRAYRHIDNTEPMKWLETSKTDNIW